MGRRGPAAGVRERPRAGRGSGTSVTDRELAVVVAVIGAGPNGRVASPRPRGPSLPARALDDGISSTTVSIRAVPDERRAAMRGDCATPRAPRWPGSGSHHRRPLERARLRMPGTAQGRAIHMMSDVC